MNGRSCLIGCVRFGYRACGVYQEVDEFRLLDSESVYSSRIWTTLTLDWHKRKGRTVPVYQNMKNNIRVPMRYLLQVQRILSNTSWKKGELTKYYIIC